MSDKRVIKKYPNRRLYDTAISSYITLEDVRQMVIDQESIQVIDAQSKQDITKYTLLQIIIELEEKGDPIFTEEMMQQLIRFYGNTTQHAISQYLEESLVLFSELQTSLSAQPNLTPEDSDKLLNEFTERKTASWRTLQQQLLDAAQAEQPA